MKKAHEPHVRFNALAVLRLMNALPSPPGFDQLSKVQLEVLEREAVRVHYQQPKGSNKPRLQNFFDLTKRQAGVRQ